jgi:hypothetical protein
MDVLSYSLGVWDLLPHLMKIAILTFEKHPTKKSAILETRFNYISN